MVKNTGQASLDFYAQGRGRKTIASIKASDKEAYHSWYMKMDIVARSRAIDRSPQQQYQMKMFEESRQMKKSRIVELTDRAYAMRRKPLKLKQEYNVKQSIMTTTDRMQIPLDDITRKRVEALDNELLNELYQIAPEILDAVYIYEVEYEVGGIKEGARKIPDRFEQLMDLLDVYDTFVGARGRHV